MANLGIEVITQGNNLQRLLQGLLVTLRISVISIVISMVIGIFFGILMVTKNPIIKWVSKIYLETIRIIPIVVWLFLVFFGASQVFHVDIPAEIVAILVFSLWGIAEMGDIVRGAVTSLPKQQTESGKAIGLTGKQIYQYIVIPQAVRRMLPAAINLSTRMIKTTSLVVLIGVVEVLKVGQQIIESSLLKNPTASFWVYGFIFGLYFIVCYPISYLSKYLEKKWKS